MENENELFGENKMFAFAEWISDIGFKKYAEGWCEAGGSNGWHCTTAELYDKFKEAKQYEAIQEPK